MCKKCKPTGAKRIDKCMRKICELIDSHPNIMVLASCCGHGKYPPSIVASCFYQYDSHKEWQTRELFSYVLIPRKKKFYKKDSQGYYYIPEVVNGKDKMQ